MKTIKLSWWEIIEQVLFVFTFLTTIIIASVVLPIAVIVLAARLILTLF